MIRVLVVDDHPIAGQSLCRGVTLALCPYRRAHCHSRATEPCAYRVAIMPELARFAGLIIQMYFDDHAPPHFHVRHNNVIYAMEIETGRMKVPLPRGDAKTADEWRVAHKDELLAAWEMVQQRIMPPPIRGNY